MKLDLKELLAKITGQTEFKTLLWTNPNPTSAMGPVTLVPSGADVYDDIEVIYKTAHIYNGYWTSRGPFSAGTYITMSATAGTGGEFSGAIYAGVRTISMFAGGKLQADGAIGMSSSGTVSNNNMCIPVKIYGIKYVGGGYCLAVFARLCAILKIGGGVDEGRYKGTTCEDTHKTTTSNSDFLCNNIFCCGYGFGNDKHATSGRSDYQKSVHLTLPERTMGLLRYSQRNGRIDSNSIQEQLFFGIYGNCRTNSILRNLTISGRGWAV